jgi:hypothetical protein
MSQPSDAVLKRAIDIELSLSDFPGGSLDKHARQLSNTEIVSLLRRLDYLERGEPDPVIRHRLAATTSFLKKDVERRAAADAEHLIQDLAAEASRAGQETCRCGARHKRGSSYYVSAMDGKRTALLSGPYPTHAECLAAVPAAREKVLRVYPESHFYSLGTVSMPGNCRQEGVLDPL